MNNEKEQLIFNKMLELYKGDPKRIQHFVKVNFFAKYIAEEEKLGRDMIFLISAASLVHDIGIHESERKYNSSSGIYQELEGPPLAEKLLTECDIDKRIVERVCFLVGHHHRYDRISGIDYRILVEADFIVNIYEDGLKKEQIRSIRNKIFRTKAGINLLDKSFDIND